MPQFNIVTSQNLDPDPVVFDNGVKVWLKAKRTIAMRERAADHMLQLQMSEEDVDAMGEGKPPSPKVVARAALIINVLVWIVRIEDGDGNDIPVSYDLVASMEVDTFDFIKATIDERQKHPLPQPIVNGDASSASTISRGLVSS